MVVKRALVGTAAISLLCACGKAPDCGVADAVAEVGQTQVGPAHYYLYSRTTGVSDKTRFLELYDQQPAFDTCGHADNGALSEAVVDPKQGVPVRVIVRGTALEIEYAGAPGGEPAQVIELVVEQNH